MWKDSHYELPPNEDKYDKIAFLIAMTGAITVAALTDNQLSIAITGVGLYIGIRLIQTEGI